MKSLSFQTKQLWLLPTILATSIESTTSYAISFSGQTILNETGDQTGTGIAVNSNGVYFTGITANNSQGIVSQYSANLGSTPLWSRTLAGGVEDTFAGVAATPNGVYAAGRSYNYTSDIVGGKERKGITVRYTAHKESIVTFQHIDILDA